MLKMSTHPEALELSTLVHRYKMLRNQMLDALARAQHEERMHGIIPWPLIHEMNGARIAFGEVALQYEALKLPA